MARKKRLFTYEFADGEVEVSSSYKARCNVTGEMIPIYHKFLEKLVKKQYKNNFALFLKTFAKKGAIQKQREEQGYKDDDKFLPWVMRIARNYCIDEYRNNKRNRVLLNSDERDYFRSIPSSISTGEDVVMSEQTCNHVKDLVDQLPAEQKEVVVMRHYYGLKFNEIAEETNSNLNTVLGRMRYALINLRKMIEEKELVL